MSNAVQEDNLSIEGKLLIVTLLWQLDMPDIFYVKLMLYQMMFYDGCKVDQLCSYAAIYLNWTFYPVLIATLCCGCVVLSEALCPIQPSDFPVIYYLFGLLSYRK